MVTNGVPSSSVHYDPSSETIPDFMRPLTVLPGYAPADTQADDRPSQVAQFILDAGRHHYESTIPAGLANQAIEIAEDQVIETATITYVRDDFAESREDYIVLSMRVFAPIINAKQTTINGRIHGEEMSGTIVDVVCGVLVRDDDANVFAARLNRAFRIAGVICNPDLLRIAVHAMKARLQSLDLPMSIKAIEDRIARFRRNPLTNEAIVDELLRPLASPRERDQPVAYTWGDDFIVWTGTKWTRWVAAYCKAKIGETIVAIQNREEMRVQSIRSAREDAFCYLQAVSVADFDIDDLPLYRRPITLREALQEMDGMEYQIAELETTEEGRKDLQRVVDNELIKVNVIPVANGLIDVNRLLNRDLGAPGCLLPHTPRYIDFACLPVELVPEATCPTWIGFLDRMFSQDGEDRSRIEVLQEYIGYCLYRGPRNFKQALYLDGGKDIGKTTLLKTIISLVGEANVSGVELDCVGKDFALSAMRGKLVNVHDDANNFEMKATGRLKKIISGAMLTTEVKWKEDEEIKNPPKLIFAGNDTLTFHDASGALMRRLLYIDLRGLPPVENPITDLSERLAEELPGILNWALEGLTRLLRNDRFTESRIIQDSLADYADTSSDFSVFASEYLIECPGSGAYCDRIFDCWKQYCGAHGIESKKSKRKLLNEIRARYNIGGGKLPRASRLVNGSRPYYVPGVAINPETGGRAADNSVPPGLPWPVATQTGIPTG